MVLRGRMHGGAGQVNVMRAITQKTIIEPYMFQLNDSQYLQSSQTLTISNRGRSPMKFSFSLTTAQGVNTYENVRQWSLKRISDRILIFL